MSVVTIAEAWPAAGRPFTVAELDRMPDDGRRYELLSGALVVSPRPTTVHQFVAMRLLRALADACPEDLCVVPEPAVMLGPQTEFDPDLVVVRMDQIGGAKFTEPPLLVVEIRSPSTALIDLNRKKAAYERFGVASPGLPGRTAPGGFVRSPADTRASRATPVTGRYQAQPQRCDIVAVRTVTM
jgi:Uma2 family endonuclease